MISSAVQLSAPCASAAAIGGEGLRRRVPELDGVRGLAIALVILCHYGGQEFHSPPHTPLHWLHVVLNFGWIGVDLFFVLSGFLIGGILMDQRESPHFFRTFFIRRVCRIFPIYYGWLLLTLVLRRLSLPPEAAHLLEPEIPFWSYFAYLQNVLTLRLGDFGPEWFGPTWSLAVEEQFYVVFPFLVRFCPPRLLPWWLLLLAFSSVLFRTVAFFVLPAPGYAGFVLLPCRWDALFLGALTAWVARRPGMVEELRRHEWVVLSGVGLSMATLVMLRVGHHGDLRSLGMHLLGLPLLAVMGCGLVLLAIDSRRRWLRRWFSLRWLRGLGTVSYGVYLIHVPVVMLCHALFWHAAPRLDSWPRFMTTLLALGLTLGGAALSWSLLESKCVAWGRRFAY